MTDHETALSIQVLRDSGLRITASRCAVLEWLDTHPHATADDIFEGVRARLGAISKQTVYGILGVCMDAGLVRQIRPDGHPARFERRIGDNHHHLICRNCGRIEDTDCKAGQRPCLTPDRDHGFDVDEAEVMFWGLCAVCKQETPNPDAGANRAHNTKEDRS